MYIHVILSLIVFFSNSISNLTIIDQRSINFILYFSNYLRLLIEEVILISWCLNVRCYVSEKSMLILCYSSEV